MTANGAHNAPHFLGEKKIRGIEMSDEKRLERCLECKKISAFIKKMFIQNLEFRFSGFGYGIFCSEYECKIGEYTVTILNRKKTAPAQNLFKSKGFNIKDLMSDEGYRMSIDVKRGTRSIVFYEMDGK